MVVEDPVAARRRLHVELRKLRLEAGLTQRRVADRLDWSPSKIIRIESGATGVSVTDLRALLAEYGVSEEGTVAGLTSMARLSRRQPFSGYRDVASPDAIRFWGYEATA